MTAVPAVPAVAEPLDSGIGWGVLHLFCKAGSGADGEAIAAAVKAHRSRPEEANQVVAVALLGHKADLGLMVLGADLWTLRSFQTAMQAAGVDVVDSYLSLTEVSEYAQAMPDELKQTRLHPRLPPPEKRAFCFYPMSKRRNVGQNWYAESYDRREELMRGHGTTGRTFAGRVVQLITGSTGLDDFEWGVTLFADTPDTLKDVVYKMRFDEASAMYAEFGPFFTGMVGGVDEVLAAVGVV